jgi:Mg/Co/Ni transporter MgtE
LQQRQNAAELQRHVRAMHAADVAYALEFLPPDDRRLVRERTAAT